MPEPSPSAAINRIWVNTLVLVVEDSATQAAQLQFRLEQHGFIVQVAGNGREALNMMQRQRPTLVITDIVMPEMDGYELCRTIKANPEYQEIPVIVVTSLSGWEDITRSLECGADNFLRKPYDLDTLVARIDYILLNLELRKESKVRTGLEIVLGGKRLYVNSEREQILDLLVSTYDEVMHMNSALQSQQLEVAHANQILRGLYQISQRLTKADTARTVCIGALHDISTLPGNRHGWVLLRDSRSNVLDLVDHAPDTHAPACLDDAACICRRMLESSTESTHAQLLHCHCQTMQGDENTCMLIVTPMAIADRMVGVMAVAPYQPVDKDDLDILSAVGQQMAVALERVELLESLNQRATQLEAANQELESFSYSVSHDLRTPLRAIDGFSRMLTRHLGTQLDHEGERLLAVIRDSCHKMDTLINALLEFSHLGRARISEAAMNMEAMVDELVRELCPDPLALGLTLRVAPLPSAPGDRVLIRQVWANLISNAIKYSAGRAERIVEISGRTDGARHIYTVKDNGAGFDMKYYDRLFGVFQRLHDDSEYAGCGIGLANVKRIVTRHGGEVWAEAVIDKGASFHFSLPAAKENQE